MLYTFTVLRLSLRGKRTGNGVLKTLCERDLQNRMRKIYLQVHCPLEITYGRQLYTF